MSPFALPSSGGSRSDQLTQPERGLEKLSEDWPKKAPGVLGAPPVAPAPAPAAVAAAPVAPGTAVALVGGAAIADAASRRHKKRMLTQILWLRLAVLRMATPPVLSVRSLDSQRILPWLAPKSQAINFHRRWGFLSACNAICL